ncbi:MAG: transglycosylase SLT domain-containing protein, partial [Pseudomonadales bacterium]|nr:transglycosylase SLT domain-containing protein [Pseudomonadales bacterium]
MQAKSFLVIFLVVFLAGCKTSAVNTSYNSNYANYDKHGVPIKAEKPSAQEDLWQLTRNNLKFVDDYSQARVIKELKYYSRYPQHMSKVSKQASPYYYYVLQEVLKRDFPAEVALLPVIESLYNPNAYSYGKASGIWQFIPSTARYLGIEINDWYDGRRDVITSTETALDYLASLNKRFDGDWMLTFAAYNGGGGTVSKAIRKNREKGLATDYWSLKLPKETTQYVPRILAIAALVNDPKKHNIELPSIANTPYFQVVDLGGQIDLSKVAKMAKVEKSQLQLLNSGFNRNVSAPNGPHRILVPKQSADRLQLALSTLDRSERLNWIHYKIQSGDSLGMIAQRYGASVRMIKDTNALSSSRIRVGKTLLIPVLNTTET